MEYVSGGEEASDNSNKRGGSRHLSHLLSFFCLLSSARSLVVVYL